MFCKNCNNNLINQADYCHNCGEKIIRNRLTLKNLFHLYAQTFFNFDNKFFQTFVNLFSKPEVVVTAYIDGLRKKYINVISYFALALTLVGLEYYIINNYFPGFSDLSTVTAKGTEHFTNSVLKFIQGHQSLLLIGMIPVFAFLIKGVFYKITTYNYTELLVVLIYVFAHTTIITAIISIISASFGLKLSAIGYELIVLKTVYLFYVLKRLYRLNLKTTIVKTLLFFTLVVCLYFVLIIALTAVFYVIKGPDFLENLITS